MPRHERFVYSDESPPKMKSPSKKDDSALRSPTSISGSSALLLDTRAPFVSAVNPSSKPYIDGTSKNNTALLSINSTKCAVCAQNGPFSARQRKRAAMGEPARCVKCIEHNVAIPGKVATLSSKKNGESAKKKLKQRLSDEQSASDSSSSSSSSSGSCDSSSFSSSSSDSSDSDSSSSSSSSSSSDSSDSDSSSSSSDSIDSGFNNDKEVAKGKKKGAVPVRNAKETKKPDNDNDSSVGALKARSKAGSFFDDEAESTWSEQEEEEGMDVSLDAIKQKILGRGIQIGYDVSPNTKDGTRMNLGGNCNMTPLQTAAAPSLKQELSCAICYEPFYQPVSLTCGHSFCRECLKWWLTHSLRATLPSTAVTHLHEKCPTCRRALTCDGASLGVNTALRACVTALFGQELQARIQADAVAKRKAAAGENGGAHSRGYKVLTDLKEAGWITLRLVGGDGAQDRLSARRSIVLDAEDQRMQLALSLRRDPIAPLRGVLQLELCLLTMEEDEAADGEGFPLVLREEEDDEHFICLEERFFSCIEAKARIDGNFGVKPTYVPIAPRVGLGQQEEEGVVRFRISVGGTPAAVALYFRHEVTGAELEIKLPTGGQIGAGSMLREREKTRLAESETNADSESDEAIYIDSKGRVANLDEYEDDGFVIMEEHEEEDYNSKEGNHEEEDVCYLCQDGGELIVCDGGDNLEGCGRNFHLECVNRDVVPPGDWVCQTCANTFEFNVGVEGHEFTVEEEEGGGGVAVEWEEEEDDDTAILPQKGRLKRKRNNAYEEENDDSDEEEFGVVASSESEMMRVISGVRSEGSLVVLPLQMSKVTKKWCVLDSDDE